MTTTTELVVAAAQALAAALPVPAPLTAGEPVACAELTEVPAALLPQDAGTAVLARLGGNPGTSVGGDIVVVVGTDLVEALATSPLGALEVSAAVQPARDAASAAVGGAGNAPAQQLEVTAALELLLAEPESYLVPLSGPDGLVVATVLVALRPTTAEEPGFEPVPLPAPADPDAHTILTTPAPQVQIPAKNGSAPSPAPVFGRGGLDLLRDVAMEVTVELGRTRMTVRELLSLTPGAVVELDRAAGSPADLLVNGTMIARGEIVVIDEDFGIRITEIVTDGAAGQSKSDQGAA